MTVYECPRCGKSLVTEEEPPGIIHKCDGCVERMVPAGGERNSRSVDTDTERDDDDLVTDGGQCVDGTEQSRLNEEFVAPRDALGQRHRHFHEPGCGSIPRLSERVTEHETRMRALEPCPDCAPNRPEGRSVDTDTGNGGARN